MLFTCFYFLSNPRAVHRLAEPKTIAPSREFERTVQKSTCTPATRTQGLYMMVECSLLAHIKRNLEWLSAEKDQVDARPDRFSRITAALMSRCISKPISSPEKGCRGDNLSLCELQKAKHPQRGISAIKKWLAVSLLRALL
jgi:hypothetical protein